MTAPAPGALAIVDDLLTTGTHFQAVASVLSTRFLGAYIVGLFMARRVPETAAPKEVGVKGTWKRGGVSSQVFTVACLWVQ